MGCDSSKPEEGTEDKRTYRQKYKQKITTPALESAQDSPRVQTPPQLERRLSTGAIKTGEQQHQLRDDNDITSPGQPDHLEFRDAGQKQNTSPLFERRRQKNMGRSDGPLGHMRERLNSSPPPDSEGSGEVRETLIISQPPVSESPMVQTRRGNNSIALDGNGPAANGTNSVVPFSTVSSRGSLFAGSDLGNHDAASSLSESPSLEGGKNGFHDDGTPRLTPKEEYLLCNLHKPGFNGDLMDSGGDFSIEPDNQTKAKVEKDRAAAARHKILKNKEPYRLDLTVCQLSTDEEIKLVVLVDQWFRELILPSVTHQAVNRIPGINGAVGDGGSDSSSSCIADWGNE